MTPEQFRQYGHQLIDLIADYRQTVGERPVMAQVQPGYLKAALPEGAPQKGEPFEAILADVDKLVMRPANLHRPDDALKEAWLLQQTTSTRARIVGVFEDRDRVVAMWRRNGLVCFQVAPGDF